MRIAVIEAPSNLGLKPPRENVEPGVRRFPDVLRNTPLYTQLGVHDVTRVEAPPYQPMIDTITGIRNASAVRQYAIALADAVAVTLKRDQFPLVVGGDCSILLGAALALRRLGHYGLFFMDGHTDFQTPQTSRTGGAAGMDLALVTGYGPPLLTTIEDYQPLFQESDVVAFGCRDADPLIFETQIGVFDLAHIRAVGIQTAVEACVQRFRQRGVDGVWLHFDVDVLDDAIMPAVDSRQPDGMTFEEMEQVIRLLRKSGLLTGIQITIFDPDLDPTGSTLETLSARLARAMQRLPFSAG